MFRVAPRLIARPTALRAVPRTFTSPARRQISTAPPSQQRRSWKSLFARIGVAGTLIYYYNTTEVFAEEPRQAVVQIPDTDVESEHLPTIEALSAERQKRKAVQAQLDAQKQKHADEGAARAAQGGIEGLEEEADQQGAFNPETGEINWDCPCLGGMAHGPCGEEFKAAFSCFVYSSEEPKGMDCIDKFKDMQNCFRQYPEIYGSELDSDADDDDDLTADAASDASAPQSTSTPASSVADEAEVQRRATVSEKSEGKLSGENKTKPQDSTTPPAPASSQTTLPEAQASPSKPSSTEAKLAEESGEQRSPPPSESSTALVPDEYKPSSKSGSN